MVFKYPFKAFLTCIVLIILNGFNHTFAQAPNITYPSHPSSYPINSPIIPLSPTNSGGTVPATVYGQVSTFAGGRAPVTYDSNGTDAGFNLPSGVASDDAGNIYVSDYGSGAIRKITPAAAVTTIANVRTPSGLVVDQQGNIFVTDFQDNYIYKIDANGTESIFAGNGSAGSNDGAGPVASFNNPGGITIDASGNLYVTDQQSNKIREITSLGVVSTLAGSGSAGNLDLVGNLASFNNPDGLVADKQGNIYVADTKNNLIRKITPAGAVSTFAGSGSPGPTNATGTAASFNYPTSLALDASGNLYVADYKNNLIRKITPLGVVSTLAGNGAFGSTNGTGLSSSFDGPIGLAADASGNMYVTDEINYMVRKIALTGYTTDKPLPPGLIFNPATGTISGTPTAKSPATPYIITAYNASGSSQYTITIAVGVNSVPTVQPPIFSYPTPQTYTTNLPITPLRPISTGGAVPATIFGSVFTFAGNKNTAGYLDATGTNAEFTNLWGIDKDASGNLYVSDDTRVRKITPAAVVNTLAGGNPNNLSDGNGTAAGFNSVAGLTVAPSGNILVGDINNRSIREITPGGTVSTFAGSGINAFNPVGVTTDQAGNIFVADQSNDVIRRITTGAIVSIYAGTEASAGSYNGIVPSAAFNNPADLKFDNSGNLYIADAGNNMIREISATGTVSTVAGSLAPGLLNGPIAGTLFNRPSALAIDAVNNIYIADAHNLVLRMINQLGEVVAVAGDNQLRRSVDGIGATATFSNLSGLVYSNGSLFATDKTCVRKIIVTGYTIDKSLPIGLTFDSATGMISGTPINPSPATTYTITGYNEGGNYSTTVTITIIASIVTAPAITYQTPKIYTVNTPIVPLVPIQGGGPPASYTINQTLPAGLTFDSATGAISGTPTVVSPAADYKITASNSGGSGSFTVNITVIAKVLTPQTITFGPIPAKTYGDADFDPGASSTNSTIPITYTTDNTIVATIINGRVHITGAGTASITAWQTGNNVYADASPVKRLLTVNKANLTIKADNKTRVFGIPNPVLTATYSGFVYHETPAQLTAPPLITTTAVETSPIGEYPITIGNASSPNYTITNVEGTLTVTAVPPAITIPNAFTPNGDGFNDEWNIKSLIDYPQCLLSVYNRYGGLIYQSKGYPKPWDGTYHGSQVPVGTYYFIIDLKNGAPQLSGYVAVIR